MNVLKLKSVDDNMTVYEYRPEGMGMFGIVSYDKTSQKVNLIKKATATAYDDLYASKAMYKIAEFVEMKNLPIRYIQAWYWNAGSNEHTAMRAHQVSGSARTLAISDNTEVVQDKGSSLWAQIFRHKKGIPSTNDVSIDTPFRTSETTEPMPLDIKIPQGKEVVNSAEHIRDYRLLEEQDNNTIIQ